MLSMEVVWQFVFIRRLTMDLFELQERFESKLAHVEVVKAELFAQLAIFEDFQRLLGEAAKSHNRLIEEEEKFSVTHPHVAETSWWFNDPETMAPYPCLVCRLKALWRAIHRENARVDDLKQKVFESGSIIETLAARVEELGHELEDIQNEIMSL